MPSHHQVWDLADSPGLHTDPFTKILLNLGYHNIFFGLKEMNPLFEKLSFNNKLSNDDEIDAFKANYHDSNPLLWFIHQSSSESFNLNSVLLKIVALLQINSRKTVIIFLQIPNLITSKEKTVPLVSEICGQCTFILPTSLSRKFTLHSSNSILDLPGYLFDLLKLSRPSSWAVKSHSNSIQSSENSKLLFECSTGDKFYCNHEFKLFIKRGQQAGKLFNYRMDPEEQNNLWSDTNFQTQKSQLLLEMLWAQFSKESMPMPRISGA
jgi:hypothetical protein